ncbi:hypothetical protein [Nocardioides stalactiti]|uniref:hypothetical protein n=1 Tax=Nocardioides stalactiti TaxID=2755356 RepID=UPI0016013FAA|nr:hypothetical protein [Nocardioides stalactiti]
MAEPSDDRPALGEPEGEDLSWPPSFPHLEIDRLIDRLEEGKTLDSAEAYRLLAFVAREAQRLRATAVRLATAKLSEADREARRIVADATAQADEIRELGLALLNTRLDEGDRLLTTVRDAFQVERRATDLARVEEAAGWAFRPFADPGDDR